MQVGVFHHIGEPTSDKFTHSIEQILAFDGLITFDGVYESVFAHRTVLGRRHPIAFVTGNQIGREGFCNKEQLLELRRWGFRLGWHGWSHDKLTETRAAFEEIQRPDWIEPYYAYPHGDFDAFTTSLLGNNGYINAYSTTQGDDKPFSLRREYV